jgi:protoporphyrinogen oxidase
MPAVPDSVLEVARHIPYRDFITVGLLVDRMQVTSRSGPVSPNGMPPDNWIYIQEPDVALGRLQIFNNWSPAMVASHPKIWLGLEYFCNQGDELWQMSDTAFTDFAVTELVKIGLIDRAVVSDAHVVRLPKAYPAYFGAYSQIGLIKNYFDTISNLYLVGRNGMHRYNNQDHSMLSAKKAVDLMVSGSPDKTAIWSVNADADYHEGSLKKPSVHTLTGSE